MDASRKNAAEFDVRADITVYSIVNRGGSDCHAIENLYAGFAGVKI
jgi:hypothetical protein